MEGYIDFLQFLNTDLSSYILSYLDDPADIVRISSVSRSWRQFGELEWSTNNKLYLTRVFWALTCINVEKDSRPQGLIII
ncbi:hypothetical protein BVC80_1787g265 [Macleaya cordata]|uniref:F-box domain-containing protein n=1 Tax=Macleaya cordata TaxID=56857 RepID=A0A200QUP2_MACCD|nr:hypothetical protein BVC80_1787g265 [Macleaya cordata]